MSKEINVYLAGAMAGKSDEEIFGWRRMITEGLREVEDIHDVKINICNPAFAFNYTMNRHQKDAEIMNWELKKVRASDVVIVNLHGIHNSVGTIMECFEAYKNNVPVLAYNPESEDVHPWLGECIMHTFLDSSELFNYIEELYVCM